MWCYPSFSPRAFVLNRTPPQGHSSSERELGGEVSLWRKTKNANGVKPRTYGRPFVGRSQMICVFNGRFCPAERPFSISATTSPFAQPSPFSYSLSDCIYSGVIFESCYRLYEALWIKRIANIPRPWGYCVPL